MTVDSGLSSNTSTNPISSLLETFRQNKREQAIVAWVNEQYSKVKDARAVTERQWYLNWSFFYGKQNVQWVTTAASASGYRLYTPPAPPWRVRLTINKIRQIIRAELSKVTSQKPTFTVVPRSTEEDDITASRVSDAIFSAAYEDKEIQTILQQAGLWALVCGTGFIKEYWDPYMIDPVNNLQGDICIENITPFHIYVPDLREPDIEKQAWVMHVSTRPIDEVRLKFQKTMSGKELKPNVTSANEILDMAYLNTIGAKPTIQDEVLIIEVWIKPRRLALFPNGAMITIASDQVIQMTEQWPYNWFEYPFSKIDHIPSGKFYATSVIEDLISVQREYNRTRSQIVESKNRMSKPQILAAEGSVDPQKITSEPGQYILYKLGFPPPQPLPLQNLPPYVLDLLQLMQTDFDDLSSQHEITRGNTPPQVTAATAISFLQEQDDSKLAPTVESLEKAVRKLGRCYLRLAQKYWDVPRLIRTVGKDQSFDAQTFAGNAIRGNTDVRVEAGSSLQSSKAAKQAVVMDLMTRGLIPPMEGIQQLPVGGIEKLYEMVQLDIRHAQRENIRMSQGQEVGVNSWDNDDLHIEQHNKYRKTQEYEVLPQETQMLYEQHCELHKMQRMQAQIEQAQLQMQTGGQENANPGQQPTTEAALDQNPQAGTRMEQPTGAA